jgi:hypothetical protein
VIRVRGYNGASSDDQVEVACYAASTIADPVAAVAVPPDWDQIDKYYALREWVSDSSEPKYVDTNAYVSEGTLVARFAELRTTAGMLVGVVVTARIAKEHGIWTLEDGVVSGRQRMDESLARLDSAMDRATSEPMCTDSPTYVRTKQHLCSFVDIAVSGDPSARCDALSWGWRFSAHPVLLVGVVDLELPTGQCPEATAPHNDTCTNLE